jgi:iron complex outermembrane receptor protein
MRFDNTAVEFGAFGIDRHLMHPIFQWLDYHYQDYGAFVRAVDDRVINGFRNRLVAGVNVINGRIDNQQFANLAGQRGALLWSSIDRSKNTSVCRGFVLFPAERRRGRGHAVSLRDARQARPPPERR